MKHAFFQPCANDELTTILHFTLKQPITLSNKKVTDVQFFKESGIVADDIDMRGGRRTDDLDELEQEERERRAKKKLTAKFHHFAELIQQ
jgi:nucleosome binding factor SPN SPT16 subunit